MNYPKIRPRRLRKNRALRNLCKQVDLSPANLIYPVFISETISKPQPIKGLPGIKTNTIDSAAAEVRAAADLGIGAVLLFGIPAKKDARGSSSLKDNGIVQKALKRIKAACPEIILITDVCLCQYTNHGHCGILKKDEVDNDATLKVLARQAVSHASCGADIVAPSAMMDGQVEAIRRALDSAGFSDTAIMSYSTKFASAFYGPFREAAKSSPKSGDRCGYQLDYRRPGDALREIKLDIGEGADMVMVKPALAYLDIIYRAKESGIDVPLAAYNTSGEYTMVKMLAGSGAADEKQLVLETIHAIRRAGADIIITYHALDIARWNAQVK